MFWPLANDHRERAASCESSFGVACLSQMIIRRDRPLANDHTSPLSSLPGSRFNLADLYRTTCSCSFCSPSDQTFLFTVKRPAHNSDPFDLEAQGLTVINLPALFTLSWSYGAVGICFAFGRYFVAFIFY